jgi:hypothetical protein
MMGDKGKSVPIVKEGTSEKGQTLRKGINLFTRFKAAFRTEDSKDPGKKTNTDKDLGASRPSLSGKPNVPPNGLSRPSTPTSYVSNKGRDGEPSETSPAPALKGDFDESVTQQPIVNTLNDDHDENPEDCDGDTKRTQERHGKAVVLLNSALAFRQGQSLRFDVQKFSKMPEKDGDSKLKEAIEVVLDSWNVDPNCSSLATKVQNACRVVFTTLRPFAQHLLTVAKDGQSVNACLRPC